MAMSGRSLIDSTGDVRPVTGWLPDQPTILDWLTHKNISFEIFVDAPFRRALLVANPISGRGLGESVARELAAGLRERGVACDIHVTRGRGDEA